ncbi:HlyD family secretion protein [Planctomycetes bacterium CA13]|uniref:HlyD family secretion protein n=1 Tax=Novipirellula herctigrandis TaxID=2527986 RepID=A0A5C5YWK2_9BACT|nr:HlyD family secretion protein [Planctomycetes bacterium CA13]
MQQSKRSNLRTSISPLIAIVAIAVVGAVVYRFTDLAERFGIGNAPMAAVDDACQSEDCQDHAGHDHAGHPEGESLELSAQARANLRLQVAPVRVGSFVDYIEVPATMSDWPGKTHYAVTAPMTGIINSISVSRGELVDSGTPLFTLRLTHQDLVNTQENFLSMLGRMDVEQREISRLTAIANSGAIAGKTLIAREYERDKLLAEIGAASQSLLLHGLSQKQIDQIERTRNLVREMTVFAPTLHTDRSLHHDSLGDQHTLEVPTRPDRYASMLQPPPAIHPEHLETSFLVTVLDVSPGQAVEAGQQLARLSDYTHILIEGSAFPRDAASLRMAADSDVSLQAVIESSSGQFEVVDGLSIAYIGNEIDRQSRALPFFVAMDNVIERSQQVGKHRYISWRYKPGQRLKLRVPTTVLHDVIVVPKEAVAEEGPDRFVFVENSDHFERVAVHVLKSDSLHVAIANDGQVWPGQAIAIRGAHQLQMAMKNQGGGAIDPHAGHNH